MESSDTIDNVKANIDNVKAKIDNVKARIQDKEDQGPKSRPSLARRPIPD
jgi:peptidoglycan hydrolase CwlO-like protein